MIIVTNAVNREVVSLFTGFLWLSHNDDANFPSQDHEGVVGFRS